ncbi:PspC domain-containing protein [Paenibacillus sp. UNC499MF]|uniref:PspC domain-containing protein n=1 Tax=Paenibacillus sp. UNC499MF TaxID=1502751 RepID=UPI00089FF358|nr:PspC domain-containing protein [Paenibacillus sp. UNC499MF]SEG37887.1 phage shock protein C (PspC) family protein [Paenibacillus sp. UNC499MF]
MNKLFRSRTDRKLTGLCGGLAQYLNVDPTVVRLIAVIGVLFSFGTFTLIYIIASLFVPKEPYAGYGYNDSYHSY